MSCLCMPAFKSASTDCKSSDTPFPNALKIRPPSHPSWTYRDFAKILASFQGLFDLLLGTLS